MCIDDSKIEIFNKLVKWVSWEMERSNHRMGTDSLGNAKVMWHHWLHRKASLSEGNMETLFYQPSALFKALKELISPVILRVTNNCSWNILFVTSFALFLITSKKWHTEHSSLPHGLQRGKNRLFSLKNSIAKNGFSLVRWYFWLFFPYPMIA